MPEILTVRTRALEIAYEAHGSASDLPVVLLHGFPDAARAGARRAPAAGRRRVSRAGSLPAWLRAHALSRSERAADGPAGGDRSGPSRLHGRAPGAARRG